MIIRASLSTLLIVAAGAALAAPASVEGLWRTPTNNGRIRIEACGAKLCGRLIGSDRLKALPDQRDVHNHDKALRGRTLKGLTIVQGFSGGPTEWTGGTVYDPAGGGTYSGRIRLVGPDQLKLTGCIVPPFCRSQTWTRVAGG